MTMSTTEPPSEVVTSLDEINYEVSRLADGVERLCDILDSLCFRHGSDEDAQTLRTCDIGRHG